MSNEAMQDFLTAQRVYHLTTCEHESHSGACVKQVEQAFGKCELNNLICAICAVRATQTENGDVVLDQGESSMQLRSVAHRDLNGAHLEAMVSDVVSDLFVDFGVRAQSALAQFRILARA
eukprot:5425727-Pyramimonas_sp.AAC.1